jgi:hypothetical protein
MPIAGWWADLANEDARIAYAAIWQFQGVPSETVTRFLQARLKPAVGLDAEAVRQWIDNLGNDDFHTREAAMKQLVELGSLVAVELRQAARSSEVAEIRKRAGELLGMMTDPIAKGDALRTVRAVSILERIGNTEARQVLTKLAFGAVGARETEEAQSALARLAAKGK